VRGSRNRGEETVAFAAPQRGLFEACPPLVEMKRIVFHRRDAEAAEIAQRKQIFAAPQRGPVGGFSRLSASGGDKRGFEEVEVEKQRLRNNSVNR
jgi:hypothetical protein